MDDDLQQRIVEGIQNALADIDQRVEELKGEHTLAADELFPSAFMREHTSFETFDAFLDAGGFEVGEEQTFDEEVSEAALDAHVQETTAFDDWAEMREEAKETWVLDQLRG